jgi:hypothetical protein
MNITKSIYFFFDNGVVLVKAGPGDIVTDLNDLKDVWISV